MTAPKLVCLFYIRDATCITCICTCIWISESESLHADVREGRLTSSSEDRKFEDREERNPPSNGQWHPPAHPPITSPSPPHTLRPLSCCDSPKWGDSKVNSHYLVYLWTTRSHKHAHTLTDVLTTCVCFFL